LAQVFAKSLNVIGKLVRIDINKEQVDI